MQPTPPAWVSWYRRLRPAELARAQERAPSRARAPARVAVYTSVYNSRDDQNLHLIRLDDMLGKKHLLPTPPNEWLKRLNINADMWRAHISPELSRALEYQQRFANFPPVSAISPPSNGAVGPGPNTYALGGHSPRSHGGHGGHGAGSVWGGWAAGAVLLALLVLIVRAAEKCLDRRLFKTRRRQSEEWSTPNVMATSLQHQNMDVDSLPHLDDTEFSSSSQRNSDLPPPYSECAPKTNVNVNKNFNNLNSEEAPPPYSACLVAFSNKDIPTVHIHRGHTIDEPQTSSEIDNINNDLIETSNRVDVEQSNYEEATMRVELVFDNGRIVERTIDIESIDNVPEIVATVGETVIRNESIDDVNNCQERVILV